MKIKALYTLSNNKKIYVSKGNEYDLHEWYGRKFIIDNHGEELPLNEEDIRYRFERVSE